MVDNGLYTLKRSDLSYAYYRVLGQYVQVNIWFKAHSIGSTQCRSREQPNLTSAMVQRCNGATVQWCNGATVQRYNRATVQRCNGATVQWCNRATVERCKDVTVQLYNDVTVQLCNRAMVQPCNYAVALTVAIVQWCNDTTVQVKPCNSDIARAVVKQCNRCNRAMVKLRVQRVQCKLMGSLLHATIVLQCACFLYG